MNTTNSSQLKQPRTNKVTTTMIIGGIALVIGLALGAAAAENGVGQSNNPPPANAALPASSEITGNPQPAMHDMQAQMDQSFDQMFQQFRVSPAFSAFKENPGYALALNVRDLKDRYEVLAYLPDAKASDVHVNLSKGQTLDVQVSGEQSKTSDQKNLAASVAEWGQYEQEIQLPTPVKAGQMKIQREGHELLITIPKSA
jgi:HSP20 family molecular chaperone IbpA